MLDFIKKSKRKEIKAARSDILSLVKLTPPGRNGAVVVGTTQRFESFFNGYGGTQHAA
jgi:glycine cleavage system pyridoxal-binding protein P